MDSSNSTLPSTKKRSDYRNWNDYYMATAFLAAHRSKDPVTPVGACIVNSDRIIVGIGYNGFPIGCSDDTFPWNKSGTDLLNLKYTYVCHAEVNAILNKNVSNLKGCTMYVALFPCNECAKVIIQSGIHEVVYMSDKDSQKSRVLAAKKMFEASSVRYWQYIPTVPEIVIDLSGGDAIGLQELRIADNIIPPEDAANGVDGVKTMKRTNYLGWTDFFMAIAFLAAQRSKDPNTQVGACIVNDDLKVVGIGYNGFPRGCSDDEFPWNRDVRADDPLTIKYKYVCHAEMNAIMNKNCANLKDCTIFTSLFPCNECAKLIIQSGIRTVVYMADTYASTPSTVAAKRMFDAAGLVYTQFIGTQNRIIIDFHNINRNNLNQLPDSPVQ